MGNILALKFLCFAAHLTNLTHFTRVKLGRPPLGGGGGSSSLGLWAEEDTSTELKVFFGAGVVFLGLGSVLAGADCTGMGNAMPCPFSRA